MFPPNLEGLFIYMTQYCFKNIGDKYINISKYAFKLLNKLILVKNKVNRVCFKTLQFLSFVQNNIFSALPETELNKESMAKRQNLFESIGHCFLSDVHDEYILNSRLIIEKVFSQSEGGLQNEARTLLMFQDIIGLVKAISTSEVLLAFMRVGYPRICELLKKIDQDGLIAKDSFLQAVTSFHYYLTLNIMDKSYSNQEITIQILRNTLLLLGNLSNRMRLGLEGQQVNKLGEVLKDNIGVLSKLFKTFKLFMKKGSSSSMVSYSVFHFFKDFTFLEYLNSSLDLIFFYVNFEHVTYHYRSSFRSTNRSSSSRCWTS